MSAAALLLRAANAAATIFVNGEKSEWIKLDGLGSIQYYYWYSYLEGSVGKYNFYETYTL